MSEPTIFTIFAAGNDEPSVWIGNCADIPATVEAPTLDEILAKISALALDVLRESRLGAGSDSAFQIAASREAEPASMVCG